MWHMENRGSPKSSLGSYPEQMAVLGFKFSEVALRDLVFPTILSWGCGDLMSMDQVTLYKCPQTQWTVFTAKDEAGSFRRKDQEKHGPGQVSFQQAEGWRNEQVTYKRQREQERVVHQWTRELSVWHKGTWELQIVRETGRRWVSPLIHWRTLGISVFSDSVLCF